MKTKGLSEESTISPAILNNIFALTFFCNTRIARKYEGKCLQQVTVFFKYLKYLDK